VEATLAKRPVVFVSYAHVDADRATIRAFREQLDKACQRKVDVLVDDRLIIGDDVSEHIKILRSCDAAIILLSPGYLDRIQKRKGGVYDEYRLIIERMQQEEDRAKAASIPLTDHALPASTFLMLPLLYSGTREASCPDEIRQKLHYDIVNFRARFSDGNELILTPQTQLRYADLYKTMASKIFASSDERLREFQAYYQRFYSSLFIDTKAEELKRTLSPEDWKRILVRTRAFDDIIRQRTLFLVGRKGSGKSTIVQHFYDELMSRYKYGINIDVDKFNLQTLYDLIYSPQTASEIRSVYQQVGFLRSVWRLFVFYACALVMHLEKETGRLSEDQRPRFAKLEHHILQKQLPALIERSASGSSKVNYFLLFSYCLETLCNDLNEKISLLGTSDIASLTDL
jgi:guanylate kinase